MLNFQCHCRWSESLQHHTLRNPIPTAQLVTRHLCTTNHDRWHRASEKRPSDWAREKACDSPKKICRLYQMSRSTKGTTWLKWGHVALDNVAAVFLYFDDLCSLWRIVHRSFNVRKLVVIIINKLSLAILPQSNFEN